MAILSLLECVTGSRNFLTLLYNTKMQGERLSPLYLYYMTRTQIGGALPHDDAGTDSLHTIEALNRFGICRESTWPYILHKFSEEPPEVAKKEASHFRPTHFLRLQSLEEFQSSLQNGRPIFVDINFAPEAYGPIAQLTGRVPDPPAAIDDCCEHSVLIIGFDDDKQEFHFLNSWGENWGDGGFGTLSYDYISRTSPAYFNNAFTWNGKMGPVFGENI
jgi:hypothetical protein